MRESYRIISVDPGYGRLGIAVLEKQNGKETLVHSECFETTKDIPQPERLNALRSRLSEVFEEFSPQALALETLFFSKNKKTALMVAEARGVITSLAASKDVPVFEYQPSQVKIAVTGYGVSDKKQVQEMVLRILKLDKKNRLDDEYDAIAVGITHLAVHGAKRF